MIAIVFKKSSLDRVIPIILSRPDKAITVSRVEYVADSVYFFFSSAAELSHASTCLYAAGIVHRCVIR